MIKEINQFKSCSFKNFRNFIFIQMILLILTLPVNAIAQLEAGVAKVNITNTEAGLVNDSLYVRALVLNDGRNHAVIITIDAVAIAEIGTIRNDYLAKVRSQLKKDLNINVNNIVINASHCHGIVRPDVDKLTVQAVKEAWQKIVPVNAGVGTGYEDRIMENRRLKLKSGREADVRHAYSLPPDEEVAEIGPVDPEIGILRLDKKNGQMLAVIYNFAMHPIQGVPNGGNTADVTGFASKIIEDNLGNGVIALFLQGCGGDINPVFYKHTALPRNAEPLGNMLGLSTLHALEEIKSRENNQLRVVNEKIELPRENLAPVIDSLQKAQTHLLHSLRGTSLNLKTFIPLMVRYGLSSEYPSYYSHAYLHDKMIGKDDLEKLDAENRRNMEAYMRNIHIMEQMTRNEVNLALLKKHQATYEASKKKSVTAEIVGIKIGDFRLITFPGELVAQIGLNIKKNSPHENTFVAGYSNGYLYYAPTAEQLKNRGGAQEDSECILAAEWQGIFENKALEILMKL
jgi:hypothetical protein